MLFLSCSCPSATFALIMVTIMMMMMMMMMMIIIIITIIIIIINKDNNSKIKNIKCKSGCLINILLFKLKLAWLSSFVSTKFKEYVISSEASQANINLNKRLIIKQPLLHWVHIKHKTEVETYITMHIITKVGRRTKNAIQLIATKTFFTRSSWESSWKIINQYCFET